MCAGCVSAPLSNATSSRSLLRSYKELPGSRSPTDPFSLYYTSIPAALFNSLSTPNVWDEEPHFLRDVQTQLERGADLNRMLLLMGALFQTQLVLSSRSLKWFPIPVVINFVSVESVLSVV